MEPIHVLIVDDHGVMRAGLRAMIGVQPDMAVVAEAADGDEAVRRVSEQATDVVVLDVELPGAGGIEVARRLREAAPSARILMLTMHDDPSLVRAALDAGASGFVVKDALGDDLLAAIRTVHQGRTYINVSMAAAGTASGSPPVPTEISDSRLSERERQVLILLAQGFTNSEIGTRLHLSPRTIGTYRARINEKLGLRTRAEIVQFALDSGVLARG